MQAIQVQNVVVENETVEHAAPVAAPVELRDLELALIGGGTGAVIFD